MSGYLIGPSGVLPSASVAATTWNSADATSGLATSNSNRTLTNSAAGNTIQAIRSVSAILSNQKVYVEHVINVRTSNVWFGFAPSNLPIGSTSLIGAGPSFAFAVNTNAGTFSDGESPDSTTAIIASCAAGDRIGVAYDSQNQKFWARKNGGVWNSVLGTGDPVAGTGSVSVVTSLAVGQMYAYAFLDAFPSDQDTSNFASSSWVDAAPSGYTQLAA